MKLSVIPEPQDKEEQHIGLYLKKNDDEEVDLIAKDLDNGQTSYILSVKPDGTISRVGSIGQRSGFLLDSQGRVLFEED